MRLGYLLLALLMVSGLILGCSQPTASPSPSPTASPKPTASPTAAPQVFKLKFSGGFNKGDDWYESSITRWVKPLEARSNGRLQFDTFGAGELVSAANLHDAVAKGTVDVSSNAWIWNTGTIPEANITWVPVLFDDAPQLVKAYWEAIRPYMDKLYRTKYNQTVLSLVNTSWINLWTAKPVTKMEDLKGMKIRAQGGVSSKFLELLGASVVSMTATEAIPALQTGALNGVTYNASSIIDNNLQNVVKYVVMPNMQISHVEIHWNLDSWNKLPADLQTLIMDYSKEKNAEEGAISLARMEAQMKVIKDRGITQNTLSADELAKWKGDIAQKSWDYMSTLGPGAKEIMDITRKYLNK